MSSSFADDFFQKLYEGELARKDKHDAADSFLLATLTVLGGVGATFFKVLPQEFTGNASYAFAFLSALYGILLTLAVLCLAKGIFRLKMAYLSDPQEFQAFTEGLRAFYGFEEKDEEKLQAAVDLELRKRTRYQYVECGSIVRYTNLEKLSWQTRCKAFLIGAVVVGLANTIPMFILMRSHEDVQKVKIVEYPAVATPPAASN